MSEKASNGILAAVLGAVMAVSSVGCLISAFDLKIEQFPMIVMVAGLFAIIGAIGFSFRHGTWVVLGILGMAAIFFWGGGDAQTQTQALITNLSYVYDQAYHWGVIRFPGAWYGVKADLPMVILATVVALTVTWVICKPRPAVFALVISFLPVVPCLVVTDSVPNSVCVLALLIGMLVLLLTAAARRRDPQLSPKLTPIALVAVVASVGMLFAAVPQDGYRNPYQNIQNQILEIFGFESSTGGGTGGKVEGVDLQGLGSRFFLQYPVMEIVAPEDGIVYLRERDFNIYNGYSWDSNKERTDSIASMPYGDDVGAQKFSVKTRWERAALMVPYYVTGRVELSDGIVPNADRVIEYAWSVLSVDDDWKDQIPNEASDPAMMSSDVIEYNQYHSLPAATQGWAQELLQTILTDEQSATAKADTIAAYVKQSALYEDDCARMPSSRDDFAKWFIEEGVSGYCVHFSTATAVLLRAAGVNTRYVTGYMVEAKAGETTVITADMEHAWAEYYEPVLDRWIPLESTPSEPEVLPETTTTTFTTTTTTANGATTTTRPTQSTQPDEPSGPRIPWREIFAVIGKVLMWVSGAAAIVALVIGQRHWREARRNKRYAAASQNGKALILWQEIVRMGRYLGTEPPDALYQLAQKAKFSQHTLTDEELQMFVQERETLVEMLRRRSGLIRFIHRYVLRLY